MTNDLPPGLRSYVNSEQEKDREHAMKLCARYGLDYAELRRIILQEMVAESEALGKGVPAPTAQPRAAPETLYQLTEGRACYGVVVRDGKVVECAPYGRKRWMGKTEAELVAAGAQPSAAGEG